MISSVSRLQDKSSEIVESNIQCSSRGMSSSNITAISDTSSYSTSYSTSPESNQIITQKCSIFLIGDHNTHKMMTSDEIRLTVEIAYIIISEGLSFNLAQKSRFDKILYLERSV